MKKLISFKKLISLTLASTLTSCLTYGIFGEDASSLNVNKVFALWNDNEVLGKNSSSSGTSTGSNGVLTARSAGTVVNDITIGDNYYYIQGSNTDVVKLLFGASSTTLVANSTGYNKGSNYRGITPLKSSLSNLSYTKNSTFSSSAISISKGTYTVNVGSGSYPYALGFEIRFNNKSKNEAYAMYDLSVAGKAIKIVAHSTGNDTSDTSAAEYDPDENGVIPYGGNDNELANGAVIYRPTLKFMNEKGASYLIKMKNGVQYVVSKVAKATADAGNLILNYVISKDAVLNQRYSDVAGGNVISLDIVSGFTNEAVQYNIDLSNTDVEQVLTESQIDKWFDGKSVSIYVVDKANAETAANASAMDGIIDDSRMIQGAISDGKVVFSVPAKYFDNTKEKLMISLNKIDISKLPVVAGVSLTGDASGASSDNEITAPEIPDWSTSQATQSVVSAPSVDISPISQPSNDVSTSMTTTGATTIPNTGLNDNLVLIALVVMTMVSFASITIYKKQHKDEFENN